MWYAFVSITENSLECPLYEIFKIGASKLIQISSDTLAAMETIMN